MRPSQIYERLGEEAVRDLYTNGATPKLTLASMRRWLESRRDRRVLRWNRMGVFVAAIAAAGTLATCIQERESTAGSNQRTVDVQGS